MSKVAIESEKLASVLSDTASFVGASGSKLEKLASMESAFEVLVKDFATKVAQAGLIEQSDLDDFASEIHNGGLSKLSEALDFVLRSKSETTAIGQAAEKSASSVEPQSADDYWMEAWNLK